MRGTQEDRSAQSALRFGLGYSFRLCAEAPKQFTASVRPCGLFFTIFARQVECFKSFEHFRPLTSPALERTDSFGALKFLLETLSFDCRQGIITSNGTSPLRKVSSSNHVRNAAFLARVTCRIYANNLTARYELNT